MKTYSCPLTCGQRMSAPALSGHMRMHAGNLADYQRGVYARLGVPASYADASEEEFLGDIAAAYRAVTGELPKWAPDSTPEEAPAWV